MEEINGYVYHKAWLEAIHNDYLTKRWEVELYAKAVYEAMMWGRNFG